MAIFDLRFHSIEVAVLVLFFRFPNREWCFNLDPFLWLIIYCSGSMRCRGNGMYHGWLYHARMSVYIHVGFDDCIIASVSSYYRTLTRRINAKFDKKSCMRPPHRKGTSFGGGGGKMAEGRSRKSFSDKISLMAARQFGFEIFSISPVCPFYNAARDASWTKESPKNLQKNLQKNPRWDEMYRRGLIHHRASDGFTRPLIALGDYSTWHAQVTRPITIKELYFDSPEPSAVTD